MTITAAGKGSVLQCVWILGIGNEWVAPFTVDTEANAYIIVENGAKGGDLTVGGFCDHIQVAAVERRRL